MLLCSRKLLIAHRGVTISYLRTSRLQTKHNKISEIFESDTEKMLVIFCRDIFEEAELMRVYGQM